MSVHERPAKTVEWFTPPEIFTALGLHFDLDPCAPPLPACRWLPTRRYSLPADGLTAPWEGRIWLNPPYGVQAGRWLGRLAAHGDGVALVFVRSDAVWWQASAARASAICFIQSRINFVAGDPNVPRGRSGVAPAPSCLLGYGPECGEAVGDCGLGLVTIPELGQAQPLSLAAM